MISYIRGNLKQIGENMAIWYNRNEKKTLYNTKCKIMQHKWEIMQHKWQIIQYKWETIHKKKNTNWNYTIRMKKHKQHIKQPDWNKYM